MRDGALAPRAARDAWQRFPVERCSRHAGLAIMFLGGCVEGAMHKLASHFETISLTTAATISLLAGFALVTALSYLLI
jgi:hypothetical protein